MTARLHPDIIRYRREVRLRRPVIEAAQDEAMKEAKVSYKEATKPYRPGRPRSIKVGKNAPRY